MDHALGRQTLAPAYETRRPGPYWEEAIAVVWFIVGIANVPLGGPLRYLCALYFLGVFGWYYKHMIPAALRVWPIFLTPIFGALSFTWADYPGDAIWLGLLQILTFLIIVTLAQRLSLTQLFRCLMIAGIIMAAYALVHDRGIARGAQFAHKNPLSINMSLTLALCLWSALDRNLPNWQRGLGAAFVPITAYIVLNANSATGLVLMLISGAAVIGARFLWADLAQFRNLRIVMVLGALAALLIGVLILAGLPVQQYIDDFLGSLGKDTTLTGRTDLWEFADIAADERPWLGYGVGSFWNYDVGMAQTINDFAHKRPGQFIGFHNAFIEARVHIGYIGLGLFIFGVVWTVLRVVREWAKHQDLIRSLGLILMGVILVTAFTESWLWSQFNTQMHIFYLPAIAAFGASYRRYLGEALITEMPGTTRSGRIQLVPR